MPEFPYHFLVLGATGIIAYIILFVRREYLKKVLLVSIFLLTLVALAITASFELGLMSIITKLSYEAENQRVRLDQITRDFTTLNERFTTLQRIAKENPQDSSTISRLMGETQQQVEAIEPATRFVAARVVDRNEGTVVPGVRVIFTIASLGGEVHWTRSVLSDASGFVSLRIPEDLSDGYLTWRVEDERFAGNREFLAVSHLSGVWDIPIKTQK